MTSSIDGVNHVTITQLCLPIGLNLDKENHSLPCLRGTLAYDSGAGCVFFSDGSRWYPLKYDTSLPEPVKVEPEPVKDEPTPEPEPVKDEPVPETKFKYRVVPEIKPKPIPEPELTPEPTPEPEVEPEPTPEPVKVEPIPEPVQITICGKPLTYDIKPKCQWCKCQDS